MTRIRSTEFEHADSLARYSDSVILLPSWETHENLPKSLDPLSKHLRNLLFTGMSRCG